MFKRLAIKLLNRLGGLQKSTYLYVLSYSIGKKYDLEWFYVEGEAIARKNELWDKAIKDKQSFACVLQSYAGVDTPSPFDVPKAITWKNTSPFDTAKTTKDGELIVSTTKATGSKSSDKVQRNTAPSRKLRKPTRDTKGNV